MGRELLVRMTQKQTGCLSTARLTISPAFRVPEWRKPKLSPGQNGGHAMPVAMFLSIPSSFGITAVKAPYSFIRTEPS